MIHHTPFNADQPIRFGQTLVLGDHFRVRNISNVYDKVGTFHLRYRTFQASR